MCEIAIRFVAGADRRVGLPVYQTAGAAGADLCANLPDRGQVQIAPGARAAVPTGLAMAIPEGYEVQLRPRSGLALRQGLTMVNAPGTVDWDYRGEVQVLLINLGQAPVVVAHGDRIAQMVVAPVVRARFREVEDLGQTRRGTGGFGSTGVRG